MQLGTDLVEGRFVARLNRFAALVDVNGREELVHVANSGRMRELFVPGFRVLLKPRTGEHRKTRFDLALVDLGFYPVVRRCPAAQWFGGPRPLSWEA